MVSVLDFKFELHVPDLGACSQKQNQKAQLSQTRCRHVPHAGPEPDTNFVIQNAIEDVSAGAPWQTERRYSIQ